jgi:hypothetical protein
MRVDLRAVVWALGLTLGLTACTGVKEQLGLTKQPPDEFRVQARAPLSMPPDFNLRPPRQGAPRLQERTPQQQARRAVFRIEDAAVPALNGATNGDRRSQGEHALLAAAGAGQADPNIRAIVDRETGILNENDQGFLDFLVFWRDEKPSGSVINAEQEAKRLRENAALGKPVTAGETPTIERRRKALFEGIF